MDQLSLNYSSLENLYQNEYMLETMHGVAQEIDCFRTTLLFKPQKAQKCAKWQNKGHHSKFQGFTAPKWNGRLIRFL